MKNFSKIIALIGVVLLLNCAASMDLRLDSLKSDPDYGRIKPRITFDEFKYYTGEPGVPYKAMAQLVVQETPQVIMSRSTDEMLSYMCKKAWQNGADAVINVQMSTTNVAGGYARTSPVVKGTAIRFLEK